MQLDFFANSRLLDALVLLASVIDHHGSANRIPSIPVNSGIVYTHQVLRFSIVISHNHQQKWTWHMPDARFQVRGRGFSDRKYREITDCFSLIKTIHCLVHERDSVHEKH
jgi:hypothetical protein